MPALPWKTFRNVTREREYVVLLSELPLKSYLANPGFLRFSRQVQRQLSNAPGLLGYSLLARIVRKKFWTLSVWESERALMEFVHAEPHQNVMTALQSDMGATRFVRWTIQGEPNWTRTRAWLRTLLCSDNHYFPSGAPRLRLQLGQKPLADFRPKASLSQDPPAH